MTTIREHAEQQKLIATRWAICFRGRDSDSDQEQAIAWQNAADAFAAILAILDQAKFDVLSISESGDRSTLRRSVPDPIGPDPKARA